MQLYHLLAFLYSPVVVALSQFPAAFVSHGVNGQQFGKVILVAVFLFERGVDIGKRAVVIRVVSCIERMPPSGGRRVLLRRASYYCHNGKKGYDYGYMFIFDIIHSILTRKWVIYCVCPLI